MTRQCSSEERPCLNNSASVEELSADTVVAPRKFNVVKTNIFLRSEASRVNMLVLRGNYLHVNTLLSLLFTTSVCYIVHVLQKSIRFQLCSTF